MTISEILTREEISELKRPSDWRGALAVLTTWAVISGSLALVAFFPSILTVLLALILIGGRHLALAILMHDASHYSLFRTRWLNDIIGAWLCAYPTWQHLGRYRKHHMAHHKYAGSTNDPDLDLIVGFPISKSSMRRKVFRDLIGISGIKRIYGLLLMDFGFIQYTVSSKVVPLDQKGRTFWTVVKTGVRNLYGVVITNLVLFAILALIGNPWLYLVWFGGYLTFFSVFVRIRSIAEHACTKMDLDPFKSTRSTEANAVARLTVAPHRVNYHLEHHLLMTVPYFNLPKMHRLLKERGALKHAFNAKGYFEVLRIATKRS